MDVMVDDTSGSLAHLANSLALQNIALSRIPSLGILAPELDSQDPWCSRVLTELLDQSRPCRGKT